MNQHLSLNRRDFLGTAAGLTLALTILPQRFGGMDEAVADASLAPNAWLTITPDGTITIVSPAAEMGQGSFTTLPLILAEELDADWSKVKPILPPAWEDKKYGNPEYGMTFQTSASASVHGYFKPLRIAGAQARRVLLDAVAAKWNVPVAELSTEPSVVVHKASGRRIGYGEVAAFAQAPAELPKIADKDLKRPASFRLYRQGRRRASRCRSRSRAPPNTASTCRFPAWSTPPCCNRPIRAARRRACDDKAARQVPGITDVVRLPEGVGVVGDTVEGTQAAKNLLKVTWTDAPGAHLDSEQALEEFAAIGRDKSRQGVVYAKDGDAKAAMAGAAKVYRGEYRTRYVYHAQMEPMNATASVSADGKSAEVWIGTQGASGLLNTVARLLQTDRSQHHPAPAFPRRRLRPARRSTRWCSTRSGSPRRSESPSS